MSKFWQAYEECLCEAVTARPDLYALVPGESATSYAFRVRQKMQAAGMGRVNWDGGGFRRLAKRLGIKHTRTALVAAAQEI